MKVLCRKIVNDITGEDDGKEDGWVKVDKEYTILSMSYSKRKGFYICFQTENHGEPALFRLTGFEFTSHYIPSAWITRVKEYEEENYINMMPASWNYKSFFDDLEDEEEHAMKLFHEEAQKIYEEEALYEASRNK